MIQRIQSIYLLLASIASSALFGLPFATATAQPEGLLQDGSFDINDHLGLMLLTGLIAVVAMGTIFLYKNRTLQMNLGKLNIVLLVALLVLTAYLYFTIQVATTLGFGLVLPILVFAFIFLANRSIYKDERLVRSADRLR